MVDATARSSVGNLDVCLASTLVGVMALTSAVDWVCNWVGWMGDSMVERRALKTAAE